MPLPALPALPALLAAAACALAAPPATAQAAPADAAQAAPADAAQAAPADAAQAAPADAETARARVRRHAPAQGVAAFEGAGQAEETARRLWVAPGFRINVFATGLGHSRMLETGPDGTVYVTRRDAGDVLALADTDGDGRADVQRVFLAGLPGVHGITLHGGDLVLATQTRVYRVPLAAPVPRPIVTGLPDGGQHPNRMVRSGPDGQLYVSVGSSCNDCAEDNQLERATLIRYAPDGRHREVIANGLRNTIGYDWHPVTGELWGMDHGSDFRGDRLPPEELNRIVAGRNYGWPICYAHAVVDPMTNARPQDMALKPGQREPLRRPISREAYCARTEPAVLTTEAHAAPMALRFHRGGGEAFPPSHRHDAFVALHGSWNRGDPVGYQVLRLRFDAAGQPLGFEDFVSGFLAAGGERALGRPVGIAFAADGALLFSDDAYGVIYRVSRAR